MRKGKGGKRAVRVMIKMERKMIMAGSRGSGIMCEYCIFRNLDCYGYTRPDRTQTLAQTGPSPFASFVCLGTQSDISVLHLQSAT